MRMRKLLIAPLTAGTVGIGLFGFVLPAGAQPHTLLVTLLGGAKITMTVDVPPGTPVDQIRIPGVSLPVVGITDLTPAAPAPPPPPPPPPPPSPSPTASPPATTTPTTPTPTTPPRSTPTRTTPQGGSVDPSPSGSGAGPGRGGKPRTRKPQEKLQGAPARDQTERALENEAKGRGTGQLHKQGGAPTLDNPTFSLAEPGPAAIGVPNFFIDRFRIPPFLLPIYQAAGIEYGIPWQVLAGINEIETDYGRNLNVSSAGAVGWMQFLPATWRMYGVDANGDGRKDPYNPVDAIFGAARYLRAAGGDKNVTKAIFAYNHADWYVQSVLLRARLIGGLPEALVGSLTGLTQGHFPVAARATYADDLNTDSATRRVRRGNAALPVQGSATRRHVDIFSRTGAPVIAVQDGRIDRVGRSPALGRFVVLEDVYGNRYTYSHLASVSKFYAVPKPQEISPTQIKRELDAPKQDTAPRVAATGGVQKSKAAGRTVTKAPTRSGPTPRVSGKRRLFAHPTRPAAYANGGRSQIVSRPRFTTFKNYFSVALGLKRRDVTLKRLEPRSQVIAGTILGRVGQTDPKLAPHVRFEIRPAGRGAPKVDPKPILDGWKLLEATAIYRAAGKNPFFGADARNPTVGQILLMSKEGLQRRILADPHVDIYPCGRRDIEGGGIDRRVLATAEYLAASGLRPTITSLNCGHGFLTASGNVSEHSSGNALDIAKVNGIPILGHQGGGSITDITIRRLLLLQGTMKPHQIISLMTYRGTDNTLSLPDHADHIHVGFQPQFSPNSKLGRRIAAVLKPGQWVKLINRLNDIPNPAVNAKPSKYSIPAKPGSSTGHD